VPDSAAFDEFGLEPGDHLLTVLQTQQTLFTAENTLVLVRLNKYLAASSLFQALGGGWTPDGKLSSLQP